jgi:uncharacterized protein
MALSPDLITAVRRQYRLDWHGIHGADHWARVRNNGLRLAASTGANQHVVETFAFVHDACRYSDGNDPDHGPRAAAFAQTLNGTVLHLTALELQDLVDACTHHTRGMTSGFNPTVLTCWDADRLDLGRVGIRPNPDYLCTAAGKDPEVIRWACRNS